MSDELLWIIAAVVLWFEYRLRTMERRINNALKDLKPVQERSPDDPLPPWDDLWWKPPWETIRQFNKRVAREKRNGRLSGEELAALPKEAREALRNEALAKLSGEAEQ
jgi:hypothetical protein